ncbi:hypothetical protein ES703_102099 [subsurface metagenome]
MRTFPSDYFLQEEDEFIVDEEPLLSISQLNAITRNIDEESAAHLYLEQKARDNLYKDY